MTDEIEVKEKKTRKYKKTVYGSTSYMFRLSGRTEDKYRQQLEIWINETLDTDEDLSTSQALREVVKGLINRFIGYSLEEAPISPVIDLESLKQGIMNDLKEWMAEQFASPDKAAHLANVSQRAASGEAIDSDVIDNILEDFGR